MNLRTLSSIGGALVLAWCGQLMAQATDPSVGLPLDELLNTRISTAAKYEQRVTDAPASVTVITAEEIARNGWHTLADALASVPGVNLTYDRGYTFLGTRGVGLPNDYNNRFLILLNGQPMADGVLSAIDIGTALGVDLASLARIEFVRGPGSVVYGSGAMFGVINLILKSEQEASSVMVGGGSHDTTIASGRFAHDLGGGFRMSIAGSMQNGRGQDLFFKEFDTPENNNGLSVGHDYDNYRSLMATVAGHGVRFLALTSTRTKGIPTGWFWTTFNKQAEVTDGRNLLSLTAEHRLSSTGQMFVRTSYDRYDYHGQFPYDDVLATDHAVSTRLDADVRYVWDVKPSHRVTFGTEYVHNLRASYQTVVGDTENNIGGPFSVASVYAQSEFQPLHSLSVTAGLRYDDYAGVTDTLNPRGAIVWHMNDGNTFKLLYGSAFRLPTVLELSLEEPSLGIIASPNLEPEKIRQLELVWEGRLTPEVLVRISPYQLHMTGLIKQQTDAATGLTQYLNLTDVESQGVEFQADYRRGDGLWSYVSYSRQNATEHGVRMVNSPAHLAKAGISTPTSRALQGALQFIYESGRKTFAGRETPGVFLTNLTVSTKLRSSMRLSLAVRNLLDTPYATPGGPAHVQDTIPQNGRTFLL
ncbi:MAG TPA: TonB-dependent receptor, partial [Thermoanaerobaculia bacterium]